MSPTVYFVIPCYNEEEVLPETVRRLTEKLGITKYTVGPIYTSSFRSVFGVSSGLFSSPAAPSGSSS